MKKVEQQRFEFLLYINGNIICQRYFDIKGYNPEALMSDDIKELMDLISGMNNGDFGVMGIIPNHLKNLSNDYLWNYYNPHGDKQTKEEIPTKDIFERKDMYEFEIKVDGRSVARQGFIGNYFPPRIRYQVQIKTLIPSIISEIRYTFSRKNYSTNYASA